MPIGDDKKGRAERMTRSAAARANASAAAAPSGRAAAQSYTSEEDQGMFDLSDPRQDEGVDTDGEEDLMFEEEEEEEVRLPMLLTQWNDSVSALAVSCWLQSAEPRRGVLMGALCVLAGP